MASGKRIRPGCQCHAANKTYRQLPLSHQIAVARSTPPAPVCGFQCAGSHVPARCVVPTPHPAQVPHIPRPIPPSAATPCRSWTHRTDRQRWSLARIFHGSPSRARHKRCKAGFTSHHTTRQAARGYKRCLLWWPDTVPPPRLGLRAVFVSLRRPGAAVGFRVSAAGSWRARRPVHWASATPGTAGCAACCASPPPPP